MEYFFLPSSRRPLTSLAGRSAPMETVLAGIIPLSTYRASGVVEVSNNCSFHDSLQKLHGHGVTGAPVFRDDAATVSELS